MMGARQIALAVSCFASSLLIIGDVHATSCARVRAETAELELESVTVNGVATSIPAAWAGAVVTVYRDYDGTLRLRAQRSGRWLWEETLAR